MDFFTDQKTYQKLNGPVLEWTDSSHNAGEDQTLFYATSGSSDQTIPSRTVTSKINGVATLPENGTIGYKWEINKWNSYSGSYAGWQDVSYYGGSFPGGDWSGEESDTLIIRGGALYYDKSLFRNTAYFRPKPSATGIGTTAILGDAINEPITSNEIFVRYVPTLEILTPNHFNNSSIPRTAFNGTHPLSTTDPWQQSTTEPWALLNEITIQYKDQLGTTITTECGDDVQFEWTGLTMIRCLGREASPVRSYQNRFTHTLHSGINDAYTVGDYTFSAQTNCWNNPYQLRYAINGISGLGAEGTTFSSKNKIKYSQSSADPTEYDEIQSFLTTYSTPAYTNEIKVKGKFVKFSDGTDIPSQYQTVVEVNGATNLTPDFYSDAPPNTAPIIKWEKYDADASRMEEAGSLTLTYDDSTEAKKDIVHSPSGWPPKDHTFVGLMAGDGSTGVSPTIATDPNGDHTQWIYHFWLDVGVNGSTSAYVRFGLSGGAGGSWLNHGNGPGNGRPRYPIPSSGGSNVVSTEGRYAETTPGGYGDIDLLMEKNVEHTVILGGLNDPQNDTNGSCTTQGYRGGYGYGGGLAAVYVRGQCAVVCGGGGGGSMSGNGYLIANKGGNGYGNGGGRGGAPSFNHSLCTGDRGNGAYGDGRAGWPTQITGGGLQPTIHPRAYTGTVASIGRHTDNNLNPTWARHGRSSAYSSQTHTCDDMWACYGGSSNININHVNFGWYVPGVTNNRTQYTDANATNGFANTGFDSDWITAPSSPMQYGGCMSHFCKSVYGSYYANTTYGTNFGTVGNFNDLTKARSTSGVELTTGLQGGSADLWRGWRNGCEYLSNGGNSYWIYAFGSGSYQYDNNTNSIVKFGGGGSGCHGGGGTNTFAEYYFNIQSQSSPIGGGGGSGWIGGPSTIHINKARIGGTADPNSDSIFCGNAYNSANSNYTIGVSTSPSGTGHYWRADGLSYIAFMGSSRN